MRNLDFPKLFASARVNKVTMNRETRVGCDEIRRDAKIEIKILAESCAFSCTKPRAATPAASVLLAVSENEKPKNKRETATCQNNVTNLQRMRQ